MFGDTRAYTLYQGVTVSSRACLRLRYLIVMGGNHGAHKILDLWLEHTLLPWNRGDGQLEHFHQFFTCGAEIYRHFQMHLDAEREEMGQGRFHGNIDELLDLVRQMVVPQRHR